MEEGPEPSSAQFSWGKRHGTPWTGCKSITELTPFTPVNLLRLAQAPVEHVGSTRRHQLVDLHHQHCAVSFIFSCCVYCIIIVPTLWYRNKSSFCLICTSLISWAQENHFETYTRTLSSTPFMQQHNTLEIVLKANIHFLCINMQHKNKD